MSPKGYAFIDASGIVVTAIAGALTDSQLERFSRDYEIVFGAKTVVPVYEETAFWIGGSYDADSGTFSPPPTPEPEPEPIVEETTNDDAPIE